MNVFYIGVDNPVTIGSPTGWDKTNVSMSGGTISGQGSKRTVRVSAIGAASINVVADGKPSKFDFRVKRIPDPIFKVGSVKFVCHLLNLKPAVLLTKLNSISIPNTLL